MQPRSIRERHEPRDRQPAELEPEEEHQQGARDEARHADRQERGARQDVVSPVVLVGRAVDAGRDPQHQPDQQRGHHQLERAREVQRDVAGDGAAVHERCAQVTPHHAPEPVDVLDQQRPVQPQVLALDAHLLGRQSAGIPQRRQHHVPGGQVDHEEDERCRAECQEQRQDQALDDVRAHRPKAVATCRATTRGRARHARRDRGSECSPSRSSRRHPPARGS